MEIEKHHPSTEKQGVLLDEIVQGLCKMSYHRLVGAAILLLANVFHCADCVDNKVINDIACVRRKELRDDISK